MRRLATAAVWSLTGLVLGAPPGASAQVSATGGEPGDSRQEQKDSAPTVASRAWDVAASYPTGAAIFAAALWSVRRAGSDEAEAARLMFEEPRWTTPVQGDVGQRPAEGEAAPKAEAGRGSAGAAKGGQAGAGTSQPGPAGEAEGAGQEQEGAPGAAREGQGSPHQNQSGGQASGTPPETGDDPAGDELFTEPLPEEDWIEKAEPGGEGMREAGPQDQVAPMPLNSTVTPEPLSMALLGTGLFGVGAAARRRRK